MNPILRESIVKCSKAALQGICISGVFVLMMIGIGVLLSRWEDYKANNTVFFVVDEATVVDLEKETATYDGDKARFDGEFLCTKKFGLQCEEKYWKDGKLMELSEGQCYSTTTSTGEEDYSSWCGYKWEN